MPQKTIAQELDGKEVDFANFPFVKTSRTDIKGRLVYMFDDNSEAHILVRFKDGPPYMTASLSTMSKYPIKYWVCI